MVQVDVFWSYAIGAGFAVAAGRQLKAQLHPEESPPTAAGDARPDLWTDPYLVRTLLFCALLFAPSGLYLLWNFPSWETMHAGDRSLPAWLVTVFAVTNVTQGLLGYLVVKTLIRRGRGYLGYLQLVAGYFAMFFILVFGWDGKGYQRFFSATQQDFATWHGNWVAFLTSDVAITLAVMGVVLLPPLLGWMVKWMLAGERLIGLPERPPFAGIGRALALILGSVFVGGLGVAVLCALLINVLGVPVGGVASVALLVALFAPGSVVHRLYRAYGFPDLDTGAHVQPRTRAALVGSEP
jgi:hypothetical protein